MSKGDNALKSGPGVLKDDAQIRIKAMKKEGNEAFYKSIMPRI